MILPKNARKMPVEAAQINLDQNYADIFSKFTPKTGIGYIGNGIELGYSGYRLYRYWPKIGKNTWISVKILAYIGRNTSYRQISAKKKYKHWWPICRCKYICIGIGKDIGWEKISVSVSAGPLSVQP